MRVFDCFTFFNELDLLKIRCEILKELEPIHILVESAHTHTGDSKPLHYYQNKSLFDDYDICNGIASLPNDGHPWHNENAQRNAIMMGLAGFDMNDDDIVIVSDLDEVPNPKFIKMYDPAKMGVVGINMDKFSYYLNCLEGEDCWESARMTTWSHLKTTTPQKLRTDGFNTVMTHAGWHWSWLGGVEKIMEKFYAFAHQESNNSKFADPDRLTSALVTGKSMWGEDFWKFLDKSDRFPKFILDNWDDLTDKGLIKKLQ